LVLSGR